MEKDGRYGDVISFARECNTHGPCAQFVAAWLSSRGVEGVPNVMAIFRDWKRLGVEAGVEAWCNRLGFTASAPAPFCVALAAQAAGDPLLGLLDGNGVFVTRSFDRVLIDRNPQIMRAWRV
jgi:hypothetical protein